MSDINPYKSMSPDIALNLNCHKDFINEARYVFKTVFTIIGIPYREIEDDGKPHESCKILLNYGNRIPEKISSQFLIQIDEIQYSELKKNIPNLKPHYMQATMTDYGNIHFPPELIYFSAKSEESLETVLYSDKDKNCPLVSSNDQECKCAVDFVSMIYLLLSLELEQHARERDAFGRITKNSGLLSSTLFDSPKIDSYSRFLKGLLLRSAEQIGVKLNFLDIWPDNHAFALCLSHDVDRLQSWTFAKIKRAALSEYRQKNCSRLIINALKAVRSVFYKDNWSGNIKYIADLENSYDCHSTFFFISDATSKRDPRYSLSSKKITTSLERIKTAGSHVGLHGSFNSYQKSQMLELERIKLESAIKQKIFGLRQHYLRFGGQESFRAWESAGFMYDSTLGFSDEPGYRCGISYPFYPYSITGARSYGFLEIPMIIMDTVLFLKQNLSLNADQSWEVIQKFLNNTLENTGCLTINWHNNNIHQADVTGYSQLYEKILAWGKNQNAWLCSPDELHEWWKERENKIWQTP